MEKKKNNFEVKGKRGDIIYIIHLIIYYIFLGVSCLRMKPAQSKAEQRKRACLSLMTFLGQFLGISCTHGQLLGNEIIVYLT